MLPTAGRTIVEGWMATRIRSAVSSTRELMRIAYRDPEHVHDRDGVGVREATRQLGRRALLLYDGEAAMPKAAIAAADEKQDRGHDRRQILRTIAIALSVIVPVGADRLPTAAERIGSIAGALPPRSPRRRGRPRRPR